MYFSTGLAVRGEEVHSAPTGVDAARKVPQILVIEGREVKRDAVLMLGEGDMGVLAQQCEAAGLKALFLTQMH